MMHDIGQANRSNKTLLMLAALLVLAALLRVGLLTTRLRYANSDEAIIGIMAKHIVEGEHPLIYYGQSYYVVWDAYVGAPLVAWFGLNRYTLRIFPFLLSTASVVVFFLLGQRLGGRRTAWGSALVAAIPPVTWVQRQLMGDAAYAIVLFTGALSILLLIDWLEKRTRFRWLAMGGLFLVGFTAHPLMGYFMLTAGICVLFHWLNGVGHRQPHGRLARRLFTPRQMIAFSLGVGALLIALVMSVQQMKAIFDSAMMTLVSIFPIFTGLYQPANFDVYQAMIAQRGVLYQGFALLLVGVLIWLWVLGARQSWGRRGAQVLALFTGVTLGLYVMFAGLVNVKLNMLSNARFLSPLYTTMPLCVYGVLEALPARLKRVGPLALGLLLAVNVYSYVCYIPEAKRPDELAAFLQAHQIRSAYAEYWDGYQVVLEAGETVSTYIVSTTHQTGFNRVERYKAEVTNDPRPAYFYSQMDMAAVFEQHLVQKNVQFKKVMVGNYAVFWDLSIPVVYPWD